MYIKKINIKGFRNFSDADIEFHEGINVIIGHNNAGKNNLLKALQLVMEPHCKSRKLGVYDFCRTITLEELKINSPKVEISVIITKSKEDEQLDDMPTVATWLTKLEDDYEAKLTYVFALQDEKEEDYKKVISEATTVKEAWHIIQSDFLRYYVYRLYCGTGYRQKPESEKLDKFDFQFLGALRNVEDDLFSPRSQMMREVLSFFIDYQIKSNGALTSEDKMKQLHDVKDAFGNRAKELVSALMDRLESGKQPMLEYARNTGASFNDAEPDFDGDITDNDIFNALRLIVKYATGFEVPVCNNGLGYNNLIYISLLLAKMQADTDGNYLGSSAKVFPMLIIEEPEAHLHPSMQYKFLKFLKQNYKEHHRARQIFITTHSTQITSAVSLDEIICLHSVEAGKVKVCYPAKTFPDTPEGQTSKKYVQRFLDATKSDMLFANKVIMVEGVAEELLLPILARYSERSLEDEHVAVVNVGGRYFEHFLRMFDTSISNDAIPKKVACLTDRDPSKKAKAKGSKWKSCYPYELNKDKVHFDYKIHAEELEAKYSANPSIHYFSQDAYKSKTFEYDLILHNPQLNLLLTPSISNKEELEKMQSESVLDKVLDCMRDSEENSVIKTAIAASDWDDKEKCIAVIASRYLNSVGKGENALELCAVLTENFELADGDYSKKNFIVPTYIKNALTWLLT